MQRICPENLASRSIRGFTLIELMAVVVILGVLSAVAIGAYMKNVRNAHRTEVMADLSNLTLREKNFYAVTGRYASTTNNETETYPPRTNVTAGTDPKSGARVDAIPWDISNSLYTANGKSGAYFRDGDVVHGFDAIRFLPESSKSRCGYGVVSGHGTQATPPEAPPFTQTLAAEVFKNNTPEEQRYFARDWYYAFALCDFDHDGTFWAFTTSHAHSQINLGDTVNNEYRQGE